MKIIPKCRNATSSFAVLLTFVVVVLLSCTNDSNSPVFPGRSTGENNWELIFSWKHWGDPNYLPESPSWSPDCNMIAFTLVDYINLTTQIYIYDVSNDTISEISNGLPASSNPVWSPDGEWISYFCSHSDYMSTWIIRPDGTDNTVIFGSHGAPGIYGGGCDWAPNSKVICLSGGTSESETSGLYVADIHDLDNIQYRFINENNDGDYYSGYNDCSWGTVSGEFIVYTRQLGEWGCNEICITTPRGEYFDTLVPVIKDPNGETYQMSLYDWSPDGRCLLLGLSGHSLTDLWVYELKTGKFTQLTFNDDTNSGFGGASWGSNGKIVFSYASVYEPGNSQTYEASVYTIDAPQ